MHWRRSRYNLLIRLCLTDRISFLINSDRFPPSLILGPQTINRLRAGFAFDLTVLTQDWHPANHVSFWANHRDDPNAHLFQPLYIPGVGEQMMWPVHCVQNSTGAEFHPLLTRRADDVVVQKGQNPNIDSYSGFFDNGHRAQTPMDSILKQHGARGIWCFCLYSAFMGPSFLCVHFVHAIYSLV
jgi:hypothetical protein